MTPRARRCAGCGGPLPDTPPAVTSITCQFCGIVNDIPSDGSKPVVVHVDVAKAVAHAGRGLKILLAVILVSTAVGIAVPVWLATRPVVTAVNDIRAAIKDVEKATPARPGLPTFPRAATPARATPLPPADLATVVGGGWREVDVTPPPGGWNAVDPVAGIEWATAIARAWAPDARLTRVDVSRVTSTGIVDASTSPDDSVGYRFTSPARIAEWEKRAERELNAEVAYQLMMRVVGGNLTANVIRGRPPTRDRAPQPPGSLSLTEVIRRAQKSGRFAEYPFYSGYLIYSEHEGWVWYLSSLARRESLPRIRARDGAVYPFRGR